MVPLMSFHFRPDHPSKITARECAHQREAFLGVILMSKQVIFESVGLVCSVVATSLVTPEPPLLPVYCPCMVIQFGIMYGTIVTGVAGKPFCLCLLFTTVSFQLMPF